ncbi:MAG: glutamine--tRNA ligase/YqeY domain fusion protein [Polyangiaceae bacterium]|nr:glutamine--tRNA ligase/YqeY domain fusion protein [Polyangiaceae bacterium]
MSTAAPTPTDFIREIIDEHNRSGRFDGRVRTRFPPEPNGYLHIGHAKAICIDFGIAAQYGGECNLRMDDTNPEKEDQEYVDSIKEDIRWLGFQWDRELYASDYYEQLYEWAELLVEKGLAFVCDLSVDKLRSYRGSLMEPGRESPYRNRSREENLGLFRRMRAGEFPDGSRTLRAKIDMRAGNLNLRDPIMYRIKRAHHQRTGDKWCIYPMYDFAHGQSDSIEGITHSICTLEFEDHRPLYDWFLQALGIFAPQQIEFARLNLTYTVMSKRKLLQLVMDGLVRGWDDPRMPTICGLRRRGYTPESIREFAGRIGVAKTNSTVDVQLLESCIRDDLNRRAKRVMAVLRPLKVVIENYPEGTVEQLVAENNPEDAAAGTREVPFARDLFIEAEDFREDPPKQWFRLAPGALVRLKHAYIIRCERVVKDASGRVVELQCSYDPATRGGEAQGVKVRGTLHWVAATTAIDAEVRLYEHLFTQENPGENGDFIADLNPASLETLTGCKLEPGLRDAAVGDRFQFLRQGYFCVDPDTCPDHLVFDRVVTLRDTWARIEKKQG